MSDMDIKQRVGNRVNALRQKANLSITFLAYDSGIDPTYLCSVIRGERNISLIYIQKISTACGISVWEFFNDDNFSNNHINN